MEIKKKTVLLTGGRTLLGRRLSEYLRQRGYRVLWLTSDIAHTDGLCDEAFYWNVEDGVVADYPLQQADTIIHIAGASIFSKRWTPKRKREIARSRIISANLLVRQLAKLGRRPETLILASSVYYYGSITQEKELKEIDPYGNSFLGRTFGILEGLAPKFEALGMRTVILRNGLILDPWAGAYPNMKMSRRLGFDVTLGKGNQFVNWIETDDICRIYEQAIEQQTMRGVYNATSPESLPSYHLNRYLSSPIQPSHTRRLYRSSLLRWSLGEMSEPLLSGSPLSVEKLLSTGFEFEYPTLPEALIRLRQQSKEI